MKIRASYQFWRVEGTKMVDFPLANTVQYMSSLGYIVNPSHRLTA